MPRGLNIELAEKVLKQVTEHPETHNQEEWTFRGPGCGTTACLAGWTVYFAHPDAKLVWRVDPYSAVGAESATSVVINGEAHTISEAARLALNLGEYDADHLFLELDRDEAIELLELYIEEAKTDAATSA